MNAGKAPEHFYRAPALLSVLKGEKHVGGLYILACLRCKKKKTARAVEEACGGSRGIGTHQFPDWLEDLGKVRSAVEEDYLACDSAM